MFFVSLSRCIILIHQRSITLEIRPRAARTREPEREREARALSIAKLARVLTTTSLAGVAPSAAEGARRAPGRRRTSSKTNKFLKRPAAWLWMIDFRSRGEQRLRRPKGDDDARRPPARRRPRTRSMIAIRADNHRSNLSLGGWRRRLTRGRARGAVSV